MQIANAPAHPEQYITLERRVAGVRCDRTGAFRRSESPEFTLTVSRRLGVCSADIAVWNDRTGEQTVIPFDDAETDAVNLNVERYRALLPLDALCADASEGLFYFEIRLYLGMEIRYLSSVNNVDFTVTADPLAVRRFRLLVYADSYRTPDWAKQAVMYHIFVDRFSKGNPETTPPIPPRSDCKVNADWDTGIPEYAPYPGAHLDNNEFFGGNLYGVADKLDRLVALGVNCLYLSPIFKAYSNHKYDTGDYETVDEMFGGEAAFENLLREAKKRGIHVILDGVFNHTGDDSRYFNRRGSYDSLGAYQSPDSPYRDWFYFNRFPDDYACWWGIKILPKLNTNCPQVREYLLGENGIVDRYIKKGTSGWRLDVADELPDSFLTDLRTTVKAADSDALIIGEVWENAADKIAYDERRHYLSGYQLDSVMNYPIRNAILDCVKTADCTAFYHAVTEILSGYPAESAAVLMNLLGTHDTERILTVLGAESEAFDRSPAEKAVYRMSPERYAHAVKLLKIASVLQFTLPGMPSVFYGDEAGMEGFGDPFCRRPYPWGHENAELLAHYRALGALKRTEPALIGAEMTFLRHEDAFLAYERTHGKRRATVLVNLSQAPAVFDADTARTCVFGEAAYSADGWTLPAESAAVLLG